ncbi:hypothetical protein [Rickettsia hoogstraalii]|uniref:hypothetical protein n=1 Tax=Rickettsia hoogstraalii TaxID=467174 RepID=UPI000590BB48|nr:hypothetical protein [Rickettsia hoogstraalii]
MLFKNYNLVFTKVTEERTEELKELIDLMDDLCGDFTPILQLITNAAEAGINTIEFAGDEREYLGVKQFGACCILSAKKIIIDADMSDASEVFKSILFELGNAVNTELQKIKMANYNNADEYADNMEKAEHLTTNNTEKLIVEFMQSKPEAIKEILKQISPSENYQDILEESEEMKNWSFEDYQIKAGKGYEEHRNSYFEGWVKWNKIESEKFLSKLKDGYYSPEMYEGMKLETLRKLFKQPFMKDLLKTDILFKTAIAMDDNKLTILDELLNEHIAEISISNFANGEKKLSSIQSPKLNEMIFKYPSIMLGNNALSHALKANDKELIKIILNNSTLKISGGLVDSICNIGDLEIVDMFLERVEKIDMWSGFDQSWKKWNKDILNKVLKSSENVVDEYYLRTVLDNGNSETIDNVLKRSSIKEVKENLFSRALEKGYLKYIEKLTPYMPQKG